MIDALKRKRSDLWQSRERRFHHDKVPASFTTLIVGMGPPTQTLYSPDLALCNIFVGTPNEKKIYLKGKHFADVEEVKKKWRH